MTLKINQAPPSGASRGLQSRSRAKYKALIEAGIALLADVSFDEMSIALVAARAGCSVGSFYGRFADKDVFLVALQHELYAKQEREAEVLFDPANWVETGTDTVVQAVVDFVIETFSDDARGVIKAALVRSANAPEIWEPTRASGARLDAIVARLLTPRCPGSIQIMMQFLYGSLVNIVLHDPGPLRLGDPALNTHLTRVACVVLDTAAASK